MLNLHLYSQCYSPKVAPKQQQKRSKAALNFHNKNIKTSFELNQNSSIRIISKTTLELHPKNHQKNIGTAPKIAR